MKRHAIMALLLVAAVAPAAIAQEVDNWLCPGSTGAPGDLGDTGLMEKLCVGAALHMPRHGAAAHHGRHVRWHSGAQVVPFCSTAALL